MILYRRGGSSSDAAFCKHLGKSIDESWRILLNFTWSQEKRSFIFWQSSCTFFYQLVPSTVLSSRLTTNDETTKNREAIFTEVLCRSPGILGFFSSGSFGSRLGSTIPRQPDGHFGNVERLAGSKWRITCLYLWTRLQKENIPLKF